MTLEVGKPVDIHEHFPPEGHLNGPCIGRIGIVRQLATEDTKEIVECETCHSDQVIPQIIR